MNCFGLRAAPEFDANIIHDTQGLGHEWLGSGDIMCRFQDNCLSIRNVLEPSPVMIDLVAEAFSVILTYFK